MKAKILIVDNNAEFRKSLTLRLERDGYHVIPAASPQEAIERLSDNPDLVLLDVRLTDESASDRSGIDLLPSLRAQMPDLPIVVMTAYDEEKIAVEAMEKGATRFIRKPPSLVKFNQVIRDALEPLKFKREVLELKQEVFRPVEFIGDSPKILEIKRKCDFVAQKRQVTVLILGKTGTGKEVVARYIHSIGARKDGPFRKIIISTFSEQILESELFGHEKGAFTGATQRRIGHIEKADGGILFLDEIGNISLAIQAKLLDFLENKRFCRMGGTDEIEVDVQLIAATNRDLEQAFRDGEFREDLFHRLNEYPIFLPPLAERQEDIPKLAYHFLDLVRNEGITGVKGISKDVMQLLERYPWPGNVRELQKIIKRASIDAELNGHNKITPEDLPMNIRSTRLTSPKNIEVMIPEEGIDIKFELAKIELQYIEKAIEMTKGNKTQAFKLLGLNNREALYRHINSILYKYPNLSEII